MNYYDILLAKKLEDDRDPQVVGLSVTENGTYSEEGKVYKPVVVNVEGYKIADVSGLPSSIATFTDGSPLPMPKLEIAVEPQQDLHGYDAPWVGGAGKNKSEKKITEFSYSVNANGSSSVSGDILTVTTTSTNNSGVYSYLSFVESFTGKCSYSVDVKASTSASALIGMTNAGRKSVDLTTNWQRVKFEDVTFDGQEKILCIYSQGTANTIQLKDFMFETGSTAHDYEPYSNECPIIRWSAVDVSVSGVNIWDEEWEVGSLDAETGEKTTNLYMIRSKNYIPIKASTSYNIKYYASGLSDSNFVICYYGKDKSFISSETNRGVITTPSNAFFMLFRCVTQYGTTYNNDISINYPSTDTSYHAYNGSTITIQLGSTYYGGKLDVVSGVLTVDRGYIASYNGETLPSTWISDRDVYAEGTTPTVGAEVVYELATPLTIQLTPTAVKSLLGVNNLWADCGDVVDGQYFKSL